MLYKYKENVVGLIGNFAIITAVINTQVQYVNTLVRDRQNAPTNALQKNQNRIPNLEYDSDGPKKFSIRTHCACAVVVPHVCVGGRLGGQTWGNTEVEKHTETEIGRNSRSSNSSSDSATVTVPTDFQFSFVSFCARGESRRRRHRHHHRHRRWARKKFLIFCANLRLICAAFALLLLILLLLLIAVSYFPL